MGVYFFSKSKSNKNKKLKSFYSSENYIPGNSSYGTNEKSYEENQKEFKKDEKYYKENGPFPKGYIDTSTSVYSQINTTTEGMELSSSYPLKDTIISSKLEESLQNKAPEIWEYIENIEEDLKIVSSFLTFNLMEHLNETKNPLDAYLKLRLTTYLIFITYRAQYTDMLKEYFPKLIKEQKILFLIIYKINIIDVYIKRIKIMKRLDIGYKTKLSKLLYDDEHKSSTMEKVEKSILMAFKYSSYEMNHEDILGIGLDCEETDSLHIPKKVEWIKYIWLFEGIRLLKTMLGNSNSVYELPNGYENLVLIDLLIDTPTEKQKDNFKDFVLEIRELFKEFIFYDTQIKKLEKVMDRLEFDILKLFNKDKE